MNPLPNRPLLNTPSAPLSLPNVPSFDQIAYNGRPRKVLPDAGKEFPLLNGMNTISGPPTTGTPSGGPPLSILERNSHLGPGMLHQPPPPLSQLMPQTSAQSQDSSTSTPQTDKDREIDSENRQLTAIFRDEAGEWKEKLRASHEAAEKLRQSREFQQESPGEAVPWDRQREEDDDVKEDENDVEDEETSLVGEGEGTKLWKAKRTLRK